MANPEHVEILKQGVDVWNKWRKDNPDIIPNLDRSDLSHRSYDTVNFSKAELNHVNLEFTNLSDAEFTEADLTGANLSHSDLQYADFTDAIVAGAFLIEASLDHANFKRADMTDVNLCSSDLSFADISDTNLFYADMSRAEFFETRIFNAKVGYTIFADVNLRDALGLETVEHLAPSSVSIDSLISSENVIPETFLLGTGMPKKLIKNITSLAVAAEDFYSCFVSYSNVDQEFAQKLYTDLQDKGVRCWFAPEDMKIGQKIRQRIDQSIRLHDKLLLILSENSINSEWVEDEVETAYEEERNRGKTVLFPVMIDTAVGDTDQAWAAKLRRSRHIGDFTNWKDNDSYQKALKRLLKDLKAEY